MHWKKGTAFMKKKNSRLLVVMASAVMGLVSCGQEPTHTHTFVEHDEVYPNCVEEGTEAYKTCTGCDKVFDMDGNEIAAPIKTPIDSNNHKGETKTLLVTGDYKTKYEVGDSFDMENAIFKVKCDYCEGTTLSESRKSKVTIAYPTASATKFTVDDLTKENLEVTFTYQNMSTTASVTLSKKANKIEGLTPMNKFCGFKPFTTLEGVTSPFGEIVYTFSETEDGEYKTAAELGEDYEFLNDPSTKDPKTFYVKATVAEGEDYLGDEMSTTLTISHNEGTWNTESEDEDIFGCVCQTPIIFNKKVSSHQDIDLSQETNGINLDGTSYDASKDTIKSIKFTKGETTYDLGTNLASLDLAAIKADTALHGDATLDVVVTTPENGIVPAFDHEVKVPVTLATALISDVAGFTKYVQVDDATAAKSGYVKLIADIDLIAANWAPNWGWHFNESNAFSGTFDGNGKTIVYKYGHNTGLFYNLQNATVKNLTIQDKWYTNYEFCCLIARNIQNVTLDNVTTKIIGGSSTFQGETAVASVKDNTGYIGAMRVMGLTMKDCTFDASGWALGSLIGRGGNYNNFTASNCVVKAASLVEAAHSNYTTFTYQPSNVTLQEGEVAIDGLTFIQA